MKTAGYAGGECDGQHQRIARIVADGETTFARTDFYYNSSWQVLEERKATGVAAGIVIRSAVAQSDCIGRPSCSSDRQCQCEHVPWPCRVYKESHDDLRWPTGSRDKSNGAKS